MNVVDTSAIIAILFAENGSDEVAEKLMQSGAVMSAATWVELGIVVEAKSGPGGTQLLGELMARAEIQILDVDTSVAEAAIVGWRRFGKGRHPAALNYGDTFSYGLARHLGYPLLFVGDDFPQTDVAAA